MPEAEEYIPAQLVAELQSRGERLMRGYFKPETDLTELIRCSVAGNTFRSFQGLTQPPSLIFRAWAKSQLTSDMMEEFSAIKDQASYDDFISLHERDLTQRWIIEGRKPLRFGPGRKLLNLLFKRVTRSADVPEGSRQRLIQFLHVPLDEYSLTAVRRCAKSGRFGQPFAIPATVTMGWVNSPERYTQVQQLMRRKRSQGLPATFSRAFGTP